MPYAKFTEVDSGSKADFVFGIVSGISDKSEYYEIHSDETKPKAAAKNFRGLANAAAMFKIDIIHEMNMPAHSF